MSKQTCHYCKREGEYPTEIRIEDIGNAKEPWSVLTCVDEKACNERWLADHPDEEYEVR